MASASGGDDQPGTTEPAALSLFDFDDPPSAPPQAPPPLDEAAQQSDLGELATESARTPAESPPPTPVAASRLDAPPTDEPPVGNLLDGIVGQSAAVSRLQSALESPLPAYLFVGPAGAGLRGAACRFAGELLAARSATPERERRLALAEQHPDLLVFDRVGAAMTAEQARGAVRAAAVVPAAGELKVIVLPEVDRAVLIAPILLKSVEEPPPSCVFVLLAEEINRPMETLASRCVRIDFEALGEADLRALLVAEGIDDSRADFAAVAAGGSIDRARLLASDADAATRIDTWRGLRELARWHGICRYGCCRCKALEATEQAAAPLEARHEAERADADERAELYGTNVRPQLARRAPPPRAAASAH